MVTALLVVETPVTTPVELRWTKVPLVSLLVQVAKPVRFLVVPSS